MKIRRKYDLLLSESLIWSINSRSACSVEWSALKTNCLLNKMLFLLDTCKVCCALYVPKILNNMEEQILAYSLKESIDHLF